MNRLSIGLILGLVIGMLIGGFISYKHMAECGPSTSDFRVYKEFRAIVDQEISKELEVNPVGHSIGYGYELTTEWNGPTIGFMVGGEKMRVRIDDITAIVYILPESEGVIRQEWENARLLANKVARFIIDNNK